MKNEQVSENEHFVLQYPRKLKSKNIRTHEHVNFAETTNKKIAQFSIRHIYQIY